MCVWECVVVCIVVTWYTLLVPVYRGMCKSLRLLVLGM